MLLSKNFRKTQPVKHSSKVLVTAAASLIYNALDQCVATVLVCWLVGLLVGSLVGSLVY